ncbi:hypothetical protein BKA66DRAFT_436102 [Pyrenochaeta sp. MPI-SDFR-AT-0127]|nr:hypothetical protein BKA66DRAFT_436102 [Pyrenochaeta sp. MPI-SDFR-AT-0127]
MQFTAIILPLTLALTAAADPVAEANPLPHGVSSARQYHRSANDLSRRQGTPDLDPELVCGKGFNDCGDGWCCTSSQQCAGKLYDTPVCKDPTVTVGILQGTAVASPYDDLDEKLSSLTKALAEITGAPRSGGNSKPADSKATGAAAAIGTSGFGTMAGVLVAVWGLATAGGAGLLLL